MGSIFNKKVDKKCNLWDRKQYTYALFTVDKVNNCGLERRKKKKREQNVEKKRKREFQLKGNGHIKIFFRMSGGVLILILKGFFFFKFFLSFLFLFGEIMS